MSESESVNNVCGEQVRVDDSTVLTNAHLENTARYYQRAVGLQLAKEDRERVKAVSAALQELQRRRKTDDTEIILKLERDIAGWREEYEHLSRHVAALRESYGFVVPSSELDLVASDPHAVIDAATRQLDELRSMVGQLSVYVTAAFHCFERGEVDAARRRVTRGYVYLGQQVEGPTYGEAMLREWAEGSTDEQGGGHLK